MTDKRIIETTLIRQKMLCAEMLDRPFLKRFATRHVTLDHDLILLTGVRGAGKTTLALNVMSSSGMRYAYISLEDFKRYVMDDAGLKSLLEVLYKIYGDFEWLVIDEFLTTDEYNSLICYFRSEGIKILAIASGNIEGCFPKEIGYRHVLYPLSFSEYCIWHNVDTEAISPQQLAALRLAFDDFVERGGFPSNQDRVRIKSNTTRLIETIVKNDMHGDIRKVNKINLQSLAEYLVKNSPINAIQKELAERFGLRSENTAKKYLSIIKESACVYPLERFAFQAKQRNYCERIFAVDQALCDEQPENRLKTIIYLQLRRFCERHGYHMHYYGNRDLECDFALCHEMRMRTIIQIIYDYSDNVLVKEKVAGLISLAKATGCNRLYILTDNCHDTIEAKGLKIFVKPAYEFLLDKSHMIIER